MEDRDDVVDNVVVAQQTAEDGALGVEVLRRQTVCESHGASPPVARVRAAWFAWIFARDCAAFACDIAAMALSVERVVGCGWRTGVARWVRLEDGIPAAADRVEDGSDGGRLATLKPGKVLECEVGGRRRQWLPFFAEVRDPACPGITELRRVERRRDRRHLGGLASPACIVLVFLLLNLKTKTIQADKSACQVADAATVASSRTCSAEKG